MDNLNLCWSDEHKIGINAIDEQARIYVGLWLINHVKQEDMDYAPLRAEAWERLDAIRAVEKTVQLNATP